MRLRFSSPLAGILQACAIALFGFLAIALLTAGLVDPFFEPVSIALFPIACLMVAMGLTLTYPLHLLAKGRGKEGIRVFLWTIVIFVVLTLVWMVFATWSGMGTPLMLD